MYRQVFRQFSTEQSELPEQPADALTSIPRVPGSDCDTFKEGENDGHSYEGAVVRGGLHGRDSSGS